MFIYDETTFVHARVLSGLHLGPLCDTQCTGSTARCTLLFVGLSAEMQLRSGADQQ